MIKLKTLNPRFAEIGKIKIGAKGEERTSAKGGTYRLPVKYNSFVITTTEREKEGKNAGNFKLDTEVMKSILKYQGRENEPNAKIKEIPIILVFDDIDLNFYTTFASYQGKKLFCSGDGETAKQKSTVTHKTTGKVHEIEQQIKCNPETCHIFQNGKCRVSGILSCMIRVNPEFGGVYRFRTHSWNSVSNILASLQFISEQTNGILTGLPLKLKMIKKTTEEHGDVNIVTIVLDGTELHEMRKLAQLEHESRLQLKIDMKQIEARAEAAGFLKNIDDPEDVQEEYYPETINVTPEIVDIKKPVDSEQLGEAIKEKTEKDNHNRDIVTDTAKYSKTEKKIMGDNRPELNIKPVDDEDDVNSEDDNVNNEDEDTSENENELDIF